MPSFSLNFHALPGSPFGLDAMAYARVATDGIDLVIENGLKPHDYDAVVRSADGHFGDWSGGEDFSSGRVVAVATPELYEQAVQLLCGSAPMG